MAGYLILHDLTIFQPNRYVRGLDLVAIPNIASPIWHPRNGTTNMASQCGIPNMASPDGIPNMASPIWHPQDGIPKMTSPIWQHQYEIPNAASPIVASPIWHPQYGIPGTGTGTKHYSTVPLQYSKNVVLPAAPYSHYSVHFSRYSVHSRCM